MKSSSRGSGRGGRIRGPQNLSRAKTALHKMMQQTENGNKKTSDKNKRSKMDSRELMFRGQQEMSRKERRKQAKMMKKSKMIALHSKKSVVTGDTFPGSSEINNPEVPGKNREKNKRKKLNRKRKLKEEQETARKSEELAEANKEDEKTIKRLEKELHFRKNKKTKNKITPSIFKADGLDYLLDFVNADFEDVPDDRLQDVDNDGDTDGGGDNESDTDSEGDNSIHLITVNSKSKSRSAQKEDDEDLSGDEEDSDNDEEEEWEEYLDCGDESETSSRNRDSRTELKIPRKSAKRKHLQSEDVLEDVSEQKDEKTMGTSSKSSEIKMDPYGNVVGEDNKKTETYIPPQKRAKMMVHDGKKQEQLDRLQKQLKGLINRLSESNIQSISGQIEELYLINSRNDMNEIFTQLIMDSCIGLILTGERLVMEHVMLLAVLNTNIGNEVGAHFIQTIACKLDELYKQSGNYGDGKQCDNIILLFTHLYNFKVIHCTLLYDIVRKLVDGFTERDIEMLLLILKNAGLMLRKDDPSSLKEIVMQIQTKASTCSVEFQQQSRVKFMLETIYAIRNNNVRKIPNYDPAQLDHMRKILRSLVKGKGHTDSEAILRISLENLLNAEERGRWWIIGSSWAGNQLFTNQDNNPLANQKGELSTNDKTSSVISELSRQQRMNTDLRKAIFNVVMTAEDYVDAFEKVLHLSIKGGQEREVVHVLINCCLQEATFNPYYVHLGCKLCIYDRKYKMAFQFAFWDKFKILSEMSSSNIGNLALVLSQMWVSKALPISILKVIEFADIDKLTVRFLRQTLRSLLLHRSKESVMAVFSAVTSLPKLRFFREGLRLFLLHFVLPKTDNKRQNIDEEVEKKLQERVELANQTLAGEDTGAKF